MVVLAAALQAAEPIAVRATDYAIAIPPRIASGLSTFRFENKGTEPHYLRFVRIKPGHTLDDFVVWQKSDSAIPDWLESSGGAGALAPGGSETFTATLTAGSYVALCSYPSVGGTPHLKKGMFAPLQVGPEPSAVRPPAEDFTLTMHDHGFQLTAPIPGGTPVWHVHNNGTEPHQALVVRLPEGVSEFQERTWFSNGSKAPRGGEPVGGVIELDADADAWFSVELKPGRYILLCTALEEEGRHFDLGMIYRFTIE
ncbi:MAG TPA: hypothetical protein VH583_15370 [Vicinamibacterales bacterium]